MSKDTKERLDNLSARINVLWEAIEALHLAITQIQTGETEIEKH